MESLAASKATNTLIKWATRCNYLILLSKPLIKCLLASNCGGSPLLHDSMPLPPLNWHASKWCPHQQLHHIVYQLLFHFGYRDCVWLKYQLIWWPLFLLRAPKIGRQNNLVQPFILSLTSFICQEKPQNNQELWWTCRPRNHALKRNKKLLKVSHPNMTHMMGC